jgi:hypothetical protein
LERRQYQIKAAGAAVRGVACGMVEQSREREDLR